MRLRRSSRQRAGHVSRSNPMDVISIVIVGIAAIDEKAGLKQLPTYPGEICFCGSAGGI
jgi:hypothetical protein